MRPGETIGFYQKHFRFLHSIPQVHYRETAFSQPARKGYSRKHGSVEGFITGFLTYRQVLAEHNPLDEGDIRLARVPC